jgi:hypothetical protein
MAYHRFGRRYLHVVDLRTRPDGLVAQRRYAGLTHRGLGQANRRLDRRHRVMFPGRPLRKKINIFSGRAREMRTHA